MSDKTKKDQIIDLDKEVKNIGIALIVLGVLHIVFSGFLDFTWGLVLIPVGIISLFYRSKKMLLTFGILLILVGILNLFAFGSYMEEVSGFWGIFGIIQIIWGIQEINRFRKTKENPKYEIKEKKKKDFIWYGLRVGFWIMIVCWFVSIVAIIPENSLANWIFLIIWMISILFTFVVSIIHLKKYKTKFFSIISLVMASYLILTFLIGLIIGLYYSDPYDIEEYVDFSCQNFCTGIENVESYYYEYDEPTDQVICYCFDNNEGIINQKPILLE